MGLLVNPVISDIGTARTIGFQVGAYNEFAQAEYHSNFSFYQQQFGMYGYMRLTKNETYRIHYVKGTPFAWQPHNSCAWTPLRTLSVASDEVTPCRVKLNEEQCFYEETFESIFNSVTNWNGTSPITLDEAGTRIMNEMLRAITANATEGARATMVAGGLFDLNAIEFAEGVPDSTREAFLRTANSCNGWLALANQAALLPGNGHLSNGLILEADISADGERYTGNVMTLYDAYVAAAPAPLAQAVIRGGASGIIRPMNLLWIVSPSIFAAVYTAHLAQSVLAAQNMPRIEKVVGSVATPRGPSPITYYVIDGQTIVVPADEVNTYEAYLTQRTHFAYLTVSGNINLGGSFSGIPMLNGGAPNVGLLVQQQTADVREYGKMFTVAHALMATAFADTQYITGDQLTVVPD